MLSSLRSSAGTWVAKLLFGLLILSFGVWGVGDMVTSGASRQPAITVGEIEIAPQAVLSQFNRQVDQLREQTGGAMTLELARSLGLMDSVVQTMARQALLDAAALDMGLIASENAVRQAIVAERAFQDSSGTFNRAIYTDTLLRSNLTEAAYVRQLQNDLARERLASAIAGYGAAPDVQARALLRLEQEKRTGHVLIVDASKMVLDATPGAEALEALYQENTNSFMAPEYRKLTAITLTAKALEDRMDVSEKDIADFYAANPDQFRTPERRDVTQAIVDSQSKAQAIADAAMAGMTFAKAAEDAGATILPMGLIEPSGLPETFSGAVAGLAVGQVSPPLESAFGWHIFTVTKVVPPSEQALADVSADIAKRIAADRAIDALYKESANLEDALGGGATLEEAAQSLNLPVVSIESVSIDGLGPDGERAAALPSDSSAQGIGQTILNSAFTLASGQESRLEAAGDNAFVLVRVDGITPAQPRPLEAVKADLVALWENQQRQEQATALAADLLTKVKAGMDMAALADTNPAVTFAAPPATTRGAGSTVLSQQAVSALFTLNTGEATVVNEANGAAIIRLAEVVIADPGTMPDELAQTSLRLRSAMGQDILTQAIQSLQGRYPVFVNQQVLDQAF